MTRSTLWFVVLLTISGCDRQVNLNETSPLAAAPDDSQVILATNEPVVLPESAAPVVIDTDQAPGLVSAPAQSPAPSPVQEPVQDPVPNPEQVNEPAMSNRTVSVRLTEPSLLMAGAGFVQFTPVLAGDDGSIIAMSCCDSNSAWMADVPFQSDAPRNLIVRWLADISGNEIPVLEADIQVSGASEDGVDISPSVYNRAVDSDGDGVENLTELVAGTNPLAAEDVSSDFLDARVRIPRVSPSDVPIIDGRAGTYETGTTQFSGEWAAAVHVDVDGNRLSIDNLMFAEEGFGINAENHHWLALHDGTFLYVLVVIDDAGQHHFDSREVAKPWRDDSVEFFIDGDNSQAQSYDQVDDFSMHLMTLSADASGSNSTSDATPNVFRSVNSVPLPAGLVFSTGPSQGPSAPDTFASAGVNQDVYEVAIRISDLNIQLGRTFGFEVQFDDDDNAGDRDAKWGWAHPSGNDIENDFTWRDPSFMGRAVLLP